MKNRQNKQAEQINGECVCEVSVARPSLVFLGQKDRERESEGLFTNNMYTNIVNVVILLQHHIKTDPFITSSRNMIQNKSEISI